ncbi:MAG: hypothetical protein IKR25_07610 [Muribaculaceae bacterium]|nr:hypothetical protein [Muribaculaceae bacterium]
MVATLSIIVKGFNILFAAAKLRKISQFARISKQEKYDYPQLWRAIMAQELWRRKEFPWKGHQDIQSMIFPRKFSSAPSKCSIKYKQLNYLIFPISQQLD